MVEGPRSDRIHLVKLRCELNGGQVEEEIPDHELLIDFLRERLGLTGTKMSCEVQVCGACTVLVDGNPVSSCCMLAADVDGHSVLTIEGLRDLPEYVTLERAFLNHAATQCGFCTPGFMLTSAALMASGAPRTRRERSEALSGNLCRCTGYSVILDAVEEAVGAYDEN
ncbi:MAG: (2Fe-2S)-binding protein [Armatimonadetes bacterium]|nr:MAG: (2Fe-2S)-binding protein [Armatimonadota bacterium]